MKITVGTISVIAMLFLSCASCARIDRAPLESNSIRVMTFNILDDGTGRGQPLSQTFMVIQKAGADVVGLQESGDETTRALAELLGWKHVHHDILTRFPIVKSYSNGITFRMDSGQEAHIFNRHLSHAPYQPYQLMGIPYANAPFLRTEREAIASAENARGHQVAALLGQIEALPDKDLPVFVTGDFNEPSHLDWTEAAAKSGRHPIKVAYPNSLAMAKAGFVDAWRAVHPDEMRWPGFTWTPLSRPDNPKDHHDRIDFVYFRGKGVKVMGAKVVGERRKNADIVVSPYPSDHRAVVATFLLSKTTNPDGNDAKR